MKKIIIIAFCLFFSKSFSQEIFEKNIQSEVSEVTVFIKNAQITRKKTVELKQGKTILKFVNLSPFIKPKSVQVKVNGSITVLSVNHQQNFLNKLKKQEELITLENKLQNINEQIVLENTHLQILKEELLFLQENRNIGGKNQALSAANLKETSNFYSSKLTALKMDEIKRNKTLHLLRKDKFDLNKQIKTITSKRNFANGEILVKVNSAKYSKATFEISYVVENAGWLPSYDIRAKNINEPIKLIYKANIKQDTKVDWKNVKLRLSSANPNLSGVAPELKPYLLNYHTPPPRYNRNINEVSGKVMDETGGLPGVTVMIEGTTIGTSTDFNGNYSLAIPEGSNFLKFSYVGFITKTLSANKSVINVRMEADEQSLDEVVVVAYGIQREKKSFGYNSSPKREADDKDMAIPLTQVENQTTVSFEIDTPYSVLSDNKNYAVEMAKYNLPASYQYYSIPKIEKDAFLIASIQNWEQYNLLEGEANIFFEDTYVGKTILDVRFASDTLQISLGRDKNVLVSRQKVTNYSSKKFIGSKKEETREWEISVKNNKSQKIKMLVIDQIPVSTLEEIKVEIAQLSKGKLDIKTGEIKWNFTLEPNTKKDFNLKYLVKYPKNKNLVIE